MSFLLNSARIYTNFMFKEKFWIERVFQDQHDSLQDLFFEQNFNFNAH